MHVNAKNTSKVICAFVFVIQFLGGGNFDLNITGARKKFDYQSIICRLVNYVILRSRFFFIVNGKIHS